MKSDDDGMSTLKPEVTQIDRQGIWLLIDDKEYFLSIEKFPGFRDATFSQIHIVQLINSGDLHWPDLKIDLSVASIGEPEQVPQFEKTK
jgi:hypothetical protein